MRQTQENLAAFLMAGLLAQTAAPLVARQAPQMPLAPGRIRVTTELVLVNVVARDKKGNLIRDLKKKTSRCWKTARNKKSPRLTLKM